MTNHDHARYAREDSRADRWAGLARSVAKNPRCVGVLSMGECCAVALLHNNHEFLPDGYTFLDAAARLGDELDDVVRASRAGWRED
jgi:hypothetical protein